MFKHLYSGHNIDRRYARNGCLGYRREKERQRHCIKLLQLNFYLPPMLSIQGACCLATALNSRYWRYKRVHTMEPIESRTLAKLSIFPPAEAPIDSGEIISPLTGLVNFWRPASPVHRVFFALVQLMLVRCFFIGSTF